MAEAEDVITDAARHTTVYVQKLWRQHQGTRPTPSKLALSAIAQRLDLFISSVFGQSHPLRVAQTPAHPTLLAKLFRHCQAPYRTEAIPATDDTSIWLPAQLPFTDLERSKHIYRTLALQQAVRANRQSAHFIDKADTPLCADIYLLLEAHAADCELMALLPGAKRSIQVLRKEVLSRRPNVSYFSETRQPLEQFYRQMLTDDFAPSKTPAESLQQARHLLNRFAPFALRDWSAEPLLKDWWTGELRPAPNSPKETTSSATNSETETQRSRSGRLPRRPEIRQAGEDEDQPDDQSAWMVQGEESHPLAEDPFGMQRPVDRDDDTAPDEFGDLLSELSAARLVSTPGQAKEVLLSDDPPEAQAKMMQSARDPADAKLQYPEWDYRKQQYQSPGATIHLTAGNLGSQQWVDKTLQDHRVLVDSIRRRFDMLRTQRMLHRKQLDGDDIDVDAYITNCADFKAGAHFDDALYQTYRTTDRNLATTLLIDVSGSTDGWIADHRRVIDVEREALLLVCIALESLGEPYSVLAFSGNGMHGVHMQQVKHFDEPFSNEIALRISALEPEHYTRVGAALRHATAQLMRAASEHKLLLLLSDGKPNDQDIYEGRYGVEDTRQAVIEAKLQGIRPFCLTIDRQAANYLPGTFGQHNYALLTKPELLPRILLEWIKTLLTQ